MLAAHLLAQCSGRHRRGARDQHHRHHGAPIIAFAFCELLSFRLMPVLRQIGKLRLYLPGLDTDKPWAVIAPVISARPINWGA